MSGVWFTSDQHYNHVKVIDYCRRPFKHVEEMNEALIANHNAVVKPGDRVYMLGDFALGRDAKAAVDIARRLAGQKFLVFGNHDDSFRTELAESGAFVWCKDLHYLKVGDVKAMLCHYAMLTWRGAYKGTWMLHGHSHGSLSPDARSKRVDVGVDAWDYRPVSLEQVAAVMATKTFEPVDHHGRDL